MEMVELILRDLAWLVAILTGITTMIKNIKDMKGSKNKKRRSPAKKKRRR
ncbi:MULTISPECIES: hypothetical protein [Bacillus]|uniref:Uncharacterized protein n=1 Tax=Bacillus velezensis TaxID=492670 RepID=A0A7W4LXT4_BACVE|nr:MULTISPECIES: hypothetical protein [Bacillus]MEC0377745.1 hypothetical protein [Bacillus velezensis]MEC0403817.1 hypothetical protein [Bacillus velezensis]QOY28060.1 hypothetical protein BACVE_003100 [Bacillus velezensis]QQD80925.1 hypothetical protein JD965_13485 [Bacillus siamensis]QTU91805.1 hypothetical protein J9B93_12990 [Bacillus velezensis]